MTDTNKGLTTRQIFDALREGKRVTLGFENNEQGRKEETNLLNYLNVTKSRAKQALEEFGFNFDNAIFRVDRTIVPDSPTYLAIFYIEGPREVKRYSNFTISDPE